MKTYPTVLSIGEVLWDLLPSGKVYGGAPANLAYRLQELGTSVGLVSRIGSDDLGIELRNGLIEKGFSMDFVQSDPVKPTGTVPVTLGSGGDASYTILPDVAYDYIELTEELAEAARSCRAICFGTLTQRSLVSRATIYELLDLATNAVKVLDINLRKDCYSAETIRTSLQKADILKLNREETRIVSELLGMKSRNFEEFAIEAIDRFHLQLVLVTCGSEGNWAFTPDGIELHVRGYSVPVADTVGSGDNFTAAFLHKRLNNEDLEQCCLFGNKIGALVASKKGGMPVITSNDLISIDQFQRSAASMVL
jgi:fructokinase